MTACIADIPRGCGLSDIATVGVLGAGPRTAGIQGDAAAQSVGLNINISSRPKGGFDICHPFHAFALMSLPSLGFPVIPAGQEQRAV